MEMKTTMVKSTKQEYKLFSVEIMRKTDFVVWLFNNKKRKHEFHEHKKEEEIHKICERKRFSCHYLA